VSETPVVLPCLGRLRARWEARAKRRVCLGLHQLGLLKPISFVQWLVTSRCNFRCAFCEASADEARPDELSTRQGEALIDELASLRARLILSGGEPLMREDLPHLIRYAHRKAVPLGLVSNAYRVPSLWPQLCEVPWFLFFTSLDGPRDHHDGVRAPGSFDRVLQSLDLFARHQVPMLLVNTVVHHENLGLLPSLHQHLRASPATRWHLTPAAAVGRNAGGAYRMDRADLVQLARFVRDADCPGGLRVDFGESHGYLGPLLGVEGCKPFFCGAGLSRCSILPDGSVLGCHQAYDPGLAEGNVRQQSFTHIWRNGFARFRPRPLPAYCVDCEQAPICAGGCWAEMHANRRCMKAVLGEDSGQG
jgi:mycofactocin biosynthetic radical S-adenosylmethionine protein MftC